MSLFRLHHARLETETHTTKTAAFFPCIGWKAAFVLNGFPKDFLSKFKVDMII